jgi:hypothetical protein
MQNALDGADAQRAGLAIRRAEFVVHLVLDDQELLRVVHEPGSGVAQAKAWMAPVDEFGAEFVFERGDPVRDGRLRETHFFRGARDAPQAGDPNEGFDELQIH